MTLAQFVALLFIICLPSQLETLSQKMQIPVTLEIMTVIQPHSACRARDSCFRANAPQVTAETVATVMVRDIIWEHLPAQTHMLEL